MSDRTALALRTGVIFALFAAAIGFAIGPADSTMGFGPARGSTMPIEVRWYDNYIIATKAFVGFVAGYLIRWFGLLD
jgi:hypothetical protein